MRLCVLDSQTSRCASDTPSLKEYVLEDGQLLSKTHRIYASGRHFVSHGKAGLLPPANLMQLLRQLFAGTLAFNRPLYKGLANAGNSANDCDRARILASSNGPDHTPSRLTDEPTMNASASAYSPIFSTVMPEPTSVGTLTA